MKTGVLVHGCNLNIENWRHVAWGDPPDKLGRIPQGILVAAQNDAQIIVFGTGASEKKFRLGNSERRGDVLLEAEYSLEYLKTHFASLSKFDALRDGVEQLRSKESTEAFAAEILERIVLDHESRNTVDEITNAGKLFAEQNVEQAFLVSSPSHVVRCLRDAGSIFYSDPVFASFCNHIQAVPSTTCYEGTVAGDVVVVEPPHRPDRHVVPTHRRIQRMLTLQNLAYEDLVQFIEEFDDLLQRYENKLFN